MRKKYIRHSEYDVDKCELTSSDNGNCTGDISDDNDSINGCDQFGCDDNFPCDEWDLSESGDECLLDDYVESSINIGGAKLNIHKLLGVKDRGLLVDTTQNGNAVSSGDIPNFDAGNAFTVYNNEWRSMHTGIDVIKHSYVGYDFGELKLDNGRKQYSVDTFVKYDIATIKIKQGCHSKNRATRIRIERSNDNDKWYGVAIVNLEDCDGTQEINFNRSVPSRFWRIRPIDFNGGEDDYWAVRAIQLSDYEATHISNIEDKLFLENRNRAYNEFTIPMKCSYTPIDTQTNISKWGFSNLFSRSEQYVIEVSFAQTVRTLGRPFVIGDILELPSETQYTPDLTPVKKYLEVKSVAWSTNGFTPSWKPTMQNLMAEPVMASQETQDIFGDLSETKDESGLVSIFDGENNKKYQELNEVNKSIKAEANDNTPQKGLNDSKIRTFDEYDREKAVEQLGEKARDLPLFNRRKAIFSRDAMPPNGKDYTEGEEFPENPKDGDYHRLTYSVEQKIPTRLYRYSSVKEQWIFMEADERQLDDDNRPVLQEFLDPDKSSRTDLKDVDDEL